MRTVRWRFSQKNPQIPQANSPLRIASYKIRCRPKYEVITTRPPAADPFLPRIARPEKMPAASSHVPAVHKLEIDSHANWPLIRRLLALGWQYRLGCLIVLVQQVSLVALSTAALSLTGLGIDVLRARLDPQ